MAEQQANSSNMPRDNDDSPPSNMPQESLAQGNAPQDQSAATVEAVAKALRTGSDTPSRFHSAALSALSASRQASEAPETNGNDVTAAPTNGKTSEVPTNGSTVANSDGGSATPRDEPEEDRTPLTSRAIYDIAKTKIMTQRALYKLSSETGFVKLRSKPTPIKTAATGSSASGINAAVTNGTPGGDKGKGKEAAKEAAKEAGAGDKDAAKPKQASVVGWKEKGAIDSGKKEAPKAPEPTIFDTINTYIEMVDRSGMWRNCAGVFGLMFLTYVLTSLRFGIFGVAIAAAFGAQWYRNSVVRFRRTVRDDFERAYEHNALTRTLESVGWLNEFTTRFWLMFEPSLSRMVIDIADPILEQNTPGFLDSLKLTTFTLGTKAPRIDGVRTYSELEDRNVIVMDWQVSFTPNDLEDVPAVLRENKVNPKVVLTVRVGKGFVGAGMPIMVEDMVFKGKMQVKLQLGPVFPHVRTAQVCFLERPTIDFVLKPVGGDAFGVDIAHVPGLRTFILDTIHSIVGPMFYAPNHFTVDVEQLISGAVAKIPSAKGVLIINMHSARGLPKMDTFGKADPYVKVTTAKHPEVSQRTRMIEKTLAPTWNETLMLMVYSKTDTIQFEVYDWNSVGKDEKIGFVTYPMIKLLDQPELEGATMPIMMGSSERGQLTFDMSYFPVATRATQAATVDSDGNPLDPSVEAAAVGVTAMGEDETANDEDDGQPEVDSNTGLLRLFVRSASDLAMSPALAKKLSVRAEAYVNKNKAMDCAEIKGTDAPSWELGKEVFVADKDSTTIRVRLVDTITQRTVGTLKLRIDDALAHQAGDEGSDWYPLEGHVKGKLRLNVKWRPILMDPDMAGSLGQTKKLPGPPIGVVKLTCHEGRSLKNVEAASGGKSDPYVRVMVQNQIMAKTRYINSNLDPVWNETLFVPVHRINETLALECMDWNRVERHKPLGEAMLKVSRLLGKMTKDERGDPVYVKTDPVEMWAGLRQRNGKIKGEIRFRATFIPVINFDDMLSAEDKARGMLEMKIGDGGLVLGAEEPMSSSSSSSSDSSADVKHPPEIAPTKSSMNPLRMATSAATKVSGTSVRIASSAASKVSGAIPDNVNPVNIAAAAATRVGNVIPGMPNAPRDDADNGMSMFSGKTGNADDPVTQSLSRYPRLPNIDYSKFDAGVVSVVTIGCRGLLRPFAGVFVNVYLNNNKQAPLVQTQPSRRRGREHVWEDELAQAAIPEARYDNLTFDVKCRPAGASDSSDEMISIGKADFSVRELISQGLVNSAEPVWLPLDSDTGEVLVLLRYDPTEDPQLLPAESITNQGSVRVRIASASNLPAADKSGTSDPYVVATINDIKVWKSEAIKKTLNPRWNQQTEVDIRMRSKTVLTLEVFDWNQIQSHTLLGAVTIPLSELPINEVIDRDYPLDNKGKATIHLQFFFKPSYVEQHDDSSPVLLNVAQSVVAAPVTVIKGGATVVGSVVGGLFSKIGGKKKNKHTESEEPEQRTLSPAATQAMMSATNMPGEGPAAAAVGMVPLQAENSESRDSVGPMPLLPPSPHGPKHSRSQVFASSVPVSSSIDSFPLPGMLYITVNNARLSGSKARNMVVATELNGKPIYKTRVEKDATHAEWNDKHPLPLLSGSAPVLTLAVKDHSSFRGDKTLYDFTVKAFDLLKEDLVKSNGVAAGPRDVELSGEGGSLSLKLEFSGREASASGDTFDTQSITASVRKSRHGRHSSVFSRRSNK